MMPTLVNDHFQNHKRYNTPRAQLIIADIPYNTGADAYGSNPQWYVGGDNKNGTSAVAGKQFFDTDKDFRIPEFMHFASRLLKPEPKERGAAPCMIVFCAFDQQAPLIEAARACGFKNYINLVFRKNFSPQVLKANMRIVGNAEYGLVLYRDKLPLFNNRGQMVFNIMDWSRDLRAPKIHPTQKPIALLERLIELFTNPGDVVLDPCAGSGSTLIAAANLGRRGFGFEIKKEFCTAFAEKMLPTIEQGLPLWEPPEQTSIGMVGDNNA
ncbi:DNA methyltransferase [Gordonia phage GMA4]|uniref:DNA methyltransferase n=1 Tax=Gordonia phage GMA4 TaxID=1647471 RepID=UPI0006BC17C6|nr:DNA methyltransferase [Gordonia phage GMA4]AKJ72329.1 putative DNA methylase [Gordonia phage GMA4]